MATTRSDPRSGARSRAVKAAGVGPHLLERRLLDLADPLGAHSPGLPELAGRALRNAETVACLDHAALAAAEASEQSRHLGGAQACAELLECFLGSRIAH